MHTRPARAAVIALLAWKAFGLAALTQDGWCLRFIPPGPIARDATGAPHSWDLRADWRSADPACSAIVTRAYDVLADFPAWFFNLPPPSDSWPGPADRPPGATTGMVVSGFIRAPDDGVLQIAVGPDITARLAVDGRRITMPDSFLDVVLAPGIHAINIDGSLTGDRWRFVPRWRGADLWSQSLATAGRPTRLDRLVRPWGRWLTPLLVVVLLGAWTADALKRHSDANLLTWTAAATTSHTDLVRWSVPLLAAAVLMPLARGRQSTRGAFLLAGVPWLTLIVCLSLGEIGRFRLYEVGSDYWTFQRAAYRIVMQGYWLEGGTPTFWFQPLYRWFAGILHAIFGDSSVGEVYWDGAWIVVGALFSFRVTKAAVGFRWGLVAATVTLAVCSLGTPWRHVGRGLSEITSAGLVQLAALFALRSRNGRWQAAVVAGLLAAVAFYTRLNNLPMAFAVTLFALPVRLTAASLARPRQLAALAAWSTVAAVVLTLCLALLLFAWRTWYYTGVFSLTYGTQAALLAVWKPGMRLVEVLQAMASSVMMVLTLNDPPRFDPAAIPVLAGALVAIAAAAGVPRLREVPLNLSCFCLAGLSSALIARGSAYPGRFSIHIIPVTCALTVCAVSVLARRRHTPDPD